MNPVVICHGLAALIAGVAAVPLILGKVKRNPWYGVRIPAAFESEERWLEINRHGGKLLLRWAIVIAATALVGAFLSRPYWVIYDWTALVIVLGGLAVVIRLIYSHAARSRPPAQ